MKSESVSDTGQLMKIVTNHFFSVVKKVGIILLNRYIIL